MLRVLKLCSITIIITIITKTKTIWCSHFKTRTKLNQNYFQTQTVELFTQPTDEVLFKFVFHGCLHILFYLQVSPNESSFPQNLLTEGCYCMLTMQSCDAQENKN